MGRAPQAKAKAKSSAAKARLVARPFGLSLRVLLCSFYANRTYVIGKMGEWQGEFSAYSGQRRMGLLSGESCVTKTAIPAPRKPRFLRLENRDSCASFLAIPAPPFWRFLGHENRESWATFLAIHVPLTSACDCLSQAVVTASHKQL